MSSGCIISLENKEIMFRYIALLVINNQGVLRRICDESVLDTTLGCAF